MSSIYDIDGLDESQDIWQPGFQEVGARLDEYPGAEDAKRIGQMIPNLNHPNPKQKQALNILQGPGLVQNDTLASHDIELLKTEADLRREYGVRADEELYTGIVRNEIDTSHERARADNQDGGEFFKKIIERQPQSFKEKVETGDAEIFVELPKLALEEALTSSLPHFMEKYRNDIELLRHLNGQERKNKFDAISTELMKDVDCISAMQNAIRPNETETDLGLSSQDGSEPGILEEQTLAPPNKLVKAEGKGKKVPIWGYNLSYILITQAYIPKDAMIHDKAMGYIDKGKEHFRQLDVVVALTKKVKTMTKDKPQKIDFSTDEKAKELLQKAWELGFADKDKLVYTDKEAEILLSDLDTNSKILPQRAQISFNMVPTLTEKQTQLAKIVQSAHKEEKDLVQRAQSRSIKGG